MIRWNISVPVWGDEFVALFVQKSLPMLREAAYGESVRLIAHTDQPSIIGQQSNATLPIETRLIADGQWFERMSAAHRDVLETTPRGEGVVLLTADMVPNYRCLDACERAFAQGRKMVACNATRTILEDWPEDFDMSHGLSAWGWEHRHQMTRDATWPDGNAQEMPRVYFENEGSVVCRATMPHPLAILIDGRPLKFTATVDSDLIANFRPEEIHLVTDPDDLAVIELSPRDKRRPSRDESAPFVQADSRIADRYHTQHLAYPIYRWVLGHRIVVTGRNVDCGDDGAVHRLLTESP